MKDSDNLQPIGEKHVGLIDSIKLASPQDRQAAYMLIFLFAASASISLGVPIMFKDPLIYCIDKDNNKYICSEVEACSNNDNISYYIDKINGPRSFTTDFELICENSAQKRFALLLNFLGFFVGCIVITFFVIGASIRKRMISLYSIIYGISLLLMLVLSDSLFVISILLFISSFCFICCNAYIYVFITENFIGDLASSLMILVNVGWALAGIFFAIFAYFINSDWRLFLGVGGILMASGGAYFWVMSFPKNYGSLQSSKGIGIIESFRGIYEQKTILINFMIYCLIWPLYIVCYTSVLIELESVGGSLYINLILCSAIEIIAALLTTYLSKFDCGRTMKLLLTILSVCFLSFVMAPLNISESSNFVIFFFIIMMLSGKICYDIICLLVYIYIPKLTTDKYVPLFLIFSRFLSRFMNLFLPYINFFFKSFLHLHPFVFLGILWLVSRILSKFTHEVQIEGIDNLMNEFKISLVHQLSVISGGKSMASIPHDELLKNITIKGQNLSLIRKSRFQSSFGMKTQSNIDAGLTTSLLGDPGIKEYKNKYLAEENQ